MCNKTYFNVQTSVIGKITREYIKQQRNEILSLYGYQVFSSSNKSIIELHICELIKTHPKIHNALRELIVYFEKNHIVLPAYRNLQDMFTNAYSIEKHRLDKLMSLLPKNIQTNLENLIKHDDGITELNVMRADQKDFQYTAIKILTNM